MHLLFCWGLYRTCIGYELTWSPHLPNQHRPRATSCKGSWYPFMVYNDNQAMGWTQHIKRFSFQSIYLSFFSNLQCCTSRFSQRRSTSASSWSLNFYSRNPDLPNIPAAWSRSHKNLCNSCVIHNCEDGFLLQGWVHIVECPNNHSL